jgi:predicted Zn-dependent protease with MMP-like domain
VNPAHGDFRRLLRIAEEEIEAVRRSLPGPLAAAAERVTLVLQDFPTEADLEDGIESDQLGVFQGGDIRDDHTPAPPCMTLWLGNIEDHAGHSPEAYREEVRVTYLHELGHFLGLGEEDLADRDLL